MKRSCLYDSFRARRGEIRAVRSMHVQINQTRSQIVAFPVETMRFGLYADSERLDFSVPKGNPSVTDYTVGENQVNVLDALHTRLE
jgi:hypothetical protein